MDVYGADFLFCLKQNEVYIVYIVDMLLNALYRQSTEHDRSSLSFSCFYTQGCCFFFIDFVPHSFHF